MNRQEAILAMAKNPGWEGTRIRRADWDDGCFLFMAPDGRILDEGGKPGFQHLWPNREYYEVVPKPADSPPEFDGLVAVPVVETKRGYLHVVLPGRSGSWTLQDLLMLPDFAGFGYWNEEVGKWLCTAALRMYAGTGMSLCPVRLAGRHVVAPDYALFREEDEHA